MTRRQFIGFCIGLAAGMAIELLSDNDDEGG